jgi:hypothetical protein
MRRKGKLSVFDLSTRVAYESRFECRFGGTPSALVLEFINWVTVANHVLKLITVPFVSLFSDIGPTSPTLKCRDLKDIG